MYHLWINAAIQMTWKTGVGTMLAHIVHADEGGLKVGRTFLSVRIDVFLSVKRYKEKPHRRFALTLRVDVTNTTFSRFQFSHIPFLRVLYRKMHQQPLFFLNCMLAYRFVLGYLV